MGVLEKVATKVAEMARHAAIFSETAACPLENGRFKILAERIALLELGESYPVELSSVADEPQPVVADEPAPPTQWQFRAFVSRLGDNGGLSDDQKIVLAWLRFKAEGGLNG